MNVKRYIAKDVTEAMSQIREELGPDAFILNQRSIRRAGIMGIFQKRLVEVVAAYEPKDTSKKPLPSLVGAGAKQSLPQSPRQEPFDAQAAALGVLEKMVKNNVIAPPQGNETFKPYVMPDVLSGARVPTITQEGDKDKIIALETKIDNLSSTIGTLVGKMQTSRESYKGNYPAEMEPLVLSLLENEVHEEFVHKIAREVAQIVQKQDANPAEVMEQILRQYVGEAAPIKLKRFKRTVVMLVGPTGVGKTTTLAKLAAIYQLNHHSKVGVITTDTYRIAAVEQLKTYAEILEVPLSIVYTPPEIEDALREHEDKDIVFIDTAGKSPQDKSLEEEITSLIKYSDCDEVHVVLSASTSFTSLLNIINTYSFLRDFKVLFTKMDETPMWGMPLNTKFLTDKPISYMAAGQTVPDDIEVLNQRKVISRLMGREV